MKSLWNKVLYTASGSVASVGAGAGAGGGDRGVVNFAYEVNEPMWCGHLVHKKAINGRFVCVGLTFSLSLHVAMCLHVWISALLYRSV